MAPGRHELTGRDDQLVLVVAALSALAALLAPGAATGSPALDALYRAGLGASTVLLTARARRWTWLVLGGVAAVVGGGAAMVVGVAALVLAVGCAVRRSRLRLAGAVVGALALQALLRQPSYGFLGLPLLVGTAALLPAFVSGYRRCRRPTRRRIRIGLAVAGGFTVVAGGIAVISVLHATDPIVAGSDAARDGIDLARDGETDRAVDRLERSTALLQEASSRLEAPWTAPARLLPGVRQHLDAATTAASSGVELSRSARDLAAVGDLRAVKVRSGAIDLDVVEDLRRQFAATSVVLKEETARLRDVDADWLVAPFRRRIEDVGDEVRAATEDAEVADAVLEQLPALLGGDGERTYLVAFLNEAEQRGLGGFVGSYGELRAVDGRVRLVRSGSSVEVEQDADDRTATLDGPDEYLAVHGRPNSPTVLRDASSSPHFPHSASVMAQVYEQARGVEVDGVIAMDAHTVAALLELTGPIRIPGDDVPMTADNAVERILRDQYVQFADDNAARHDLLESATQLAFDRLLTTDLPAPDRIVDILGPLVRRRRLLLNADRPAEQALFRRIGADGSIAAADAGRVDETVLVAHQNLGNSKIDAYLERHVGYRTTVDATTGRLASVATVELTNDAPSTGLPDYVIGNTRGRPSGTNIANVLVYSRLRPVRAVADGVERPFRVGREAGLHVAQLRVEVAPGATARVEVELTGAVDLSDGLTVRLLPHPGADEPLVSFTATMRGGTISGDGGGAHRGVTWTDRPFTEPMTESLDIVATG